MKQKLLIQDFEVSVSLGCSPKEQKSKQRVIFNFELSFVQNLKATITDNLEDTVDYVEITEVIKQVAQKKSYQLIEHLNFEVLEALLVYLKTQNIKAELKLTVKKSKVPIKNLKNGVVFSCEAKL